MRPEDEAAAAAVPGPPVPRCPRDGVNYALQIWPMTTDQGSDVTACRKDMIAECDPIVTVWPFDSECFAHQFHIMVRNFCKAIDEALLQILGMNFKIYASVAKILHTLRDNALEMLSIWTSLYPHTAGASIGKVPPKPISGRWGRFVQCLEYLLAVHWMELMRV